MAIVIEIIEQTAPPIIEVAVPGIQGPGNLSVGPVNTLTPGSAGLWIETTGTSSDPTYNIWVQRGVDES